MSLAGAGGGRVVLGRQVGQLGSGRPAGQRRPRGPGGFLRGSGLRWDCAGHRGSGLSPQATQLGTSRRASEPSVAVPGLKPVPLSRPGRVGREEAREMGRVSPRGR